MSQTSPRLALPYIQPSQAQKHVTHNEALQQLDVAVQLVVQGVDATTPPSAPTTGEIHALGPIPTDDWAGQPGMLAMWTGGGWLFLPPQPGWRAWDLGTGSLRVWSGAAWDRAQPLDNLDGLGIGTAWDATNRLALTSPAALFSHDGAGHQLKINKASAADTASLLFQSNWTGHAEMGLAGNNDFQIKTSDDGVTFTTAFTVQATDGNTGLGTPTPNCALHLSRDDGTALMKIEETSSTVAPRTLLELRNNGITTLGLISTDGVGDFRWSIQNRGDAANNDFRITNSTGAGEEFILTREGDLSITGTLKAGGPVRAKSYTVASAPSASASGTGAMIYVSNESGGATMAFSDGANWRRMSDRAVIS